MARPTINFYRKEYQSSFLLNRGPLLLILGIRNLLNLLLVCFCFTTLPAQPYSFATFSLAEGLPQSQVFALCQDYRGYLWAGTQGGGLSRFDGRNFTTYGTSDGLPTNYINALVEDKRHQLWIGTNRGLCRFDGRQFKKIRFDSLEDQPEIYALASVQENMIWIGTNRGLFACATSDSSARAVALTGQEPPNVVTSIFPTRQGVWIGTERGVWQIGATTSRLTERDGLAGNSVCAFARDKKQRIWIASIGGIAVFDGNNLQHLQTLRDPILNRPMCLQADREGRIWVGTQQRGLLCFNPVDTSWTQLLEKDGLPHQYIRCMYLDDAGRLWLGSSGGGLARLGRQPFRHFDRSRGLLGNRIYALHEDRRGRLWMGVAASGLQVLDSMGFQKFDRDSQYLRVKCKSIAEDSEGNIWVGTEGKGIAVFDSAGMHLLNRQNGLPGDLVQKVIAGSDSSMWVAALSGGISKIHRRQQGGFDIKNFGVREGLTNPDVQTLLRDSEGKIWFATRAGQIGYIDDREIVKLYDRRHGLPGQPVRCLAIDRKGCIWAGTKGSGIFRADKKEGDIRFSVLETSGSPNIYLLTFDGQGNLWAGSETGVDQFTFDSLGKKIVSARHFGRTEGFLGIETCHDAVLEDRSGHLWFGTMNGLMQYLPGDIVKDQAPPKLHLGTVSLFYKPISETTFAAFANPEGGLLPGLELPHFQNHLSFAFQGVDLGNPGALRYRWKLEGAETDWSPPSPQTQVNYAKLPPGSYTFWVQATTDGTLFSDPVSTSFVIQEPIWQLWWFQLATGLALLILILLIAWAWVQRIRREEKARREQLELENRLLQLEQKALQLQMNPHFIFNALTSIQALLTEKTYPKARQEISRFAQLMRGILNNSRRQSISLQEEVDTLEQYLRMEQFCQRQKFDFEIILPENIDPEELELPPMLLQPFVENAVVHGVAHLNYPGKITVQFKQVDEMLFVEICDNGIGRERAAQLQRDKKPGHQSAALQVTRERLTALGGRFETRDILNEKDEIAGTKVSLHFPVKLMF